MSISSQKSGTSFNKPNTATGLGPKQWAVLIKEACEVAGVTPTATVISQALGTIDAEGGLDGSLWGNNPSHPGPWALESSFGTLQERMDPRKSTIIAMKTYKSDGGFESAWWHWEKIQGEAEPGNVRAAKFVKIAQEVAGGSNPSFGEELPLIGGVVGDVEGAVGGVIGGVEGAEDFITEAFNFLTDFRKLGQLAAEAFAWFIKLIAKAIWDYVIAPLLHWTERAVSFYWVNFFGTGTEQGSGFGYTLRQNAGSITVLFWGLGYAILWSDGNGSQLVDPHESLLGQGIKGIEGAIARRHLVEPKDVKKETPTKPKPKVSTVPIEKQEVFSVARKRPVSVTGHTEGRTRHASGRGRFTPAPVTRPGQSETGKPEGKKLVLAKGYSRRAQKPPPQKSAKPSKSRVGT